MKRILNHVKKCKSDRLASDSSLFLGKRILVSGGVFSFVAAALLSGLLVYQTSTHIDAGEREWSISLLFLFVIVIPIIVVLHEAGHAIAARLAGFDLFFISIGSGPKIFTLERPSFSLSLHLYPFSGLTAAAPSDDKNLRARMIFFSAGGLLVHFLLLLLIFLWVGYEHFWAMLGSNCSRHSFLFSIFAYCNLLIALLNLIPSTASTIVGNLPNDGLRLFMLCFSRDKTLLSEAVASHYALRGLQLRLAKKYRESIAAYEEGIKRFPESFICKSDLGVLYLERQEYERGRKYLVELLPTPKKYPLYDAILKNNIAWADLFLDDSLLEEADTLSKEALLAAPDQPVFLSTRGSVLIRQGKIQEGLKLLEKSYQKTTSDDSRAYNACWLAIGYASNGEPKVAQKYLEKAKKLNPNCPMLLMTEETISASAVPGSPPSV